MNNMRTEYWRGYAIRFIELDNGVWWAVLKDICDALHLRTAKMAERLDPSMLERVPIETERIRPTKYKEKYDVPLKDTVKTKSTVYMLAVNQRGIYQALFASRKLEARKFQVWTFDILDKLRRNVGLHEYDIMRMADPDIQEAIDHILDTLFWDEKTGILMQSVTVQGGDVEQVPFDI